MNPMKSILITGVLLASLTGSNAFAHCQVPCGIYDDAARFTLMEEHVATIEKSMKQVISLSGPENTTASTGSYNQIVRWVENKDRHADELSELVTYYFLAQRVKPIDKENKEAYGKYVNEVVWLHQIVVHSMKAKQTTDLGYVEKLRDLIEKFKKSYLGK